MMRTLFSVLLVLGPALAFGYFRMPTEMSIAIVAGSIAAAFVNIDRIKRFKGAGFEAEMKEAVQKAYATIDSIRKLAKPLIHSTLDILTMTGRWGGMDPQQKHAFREELEQVAKELTINDDLGLLSAHDKFFQYHTWDHFNCFASRVYQINVIPEETRKKLTLLKNYKSSTYPSRDDIEKILGDHIRKLELKHKEELEDYLYYCKHRRFRRPQALSRE